MIKVQLQQDINSHKINNHGLQPVDKKQVLVRIFANPDNYREAKIVTKQNTEDQIDTKF